MTRRNAFPTTARPWPGQRDEIPISTLEAWGLTVSVAWPDGLPVSTPPRLDLEGDAPLVEVPVDWDAVCGRRPDLAREWQDVVRRSLEAAFARGYAAVDCLYEREGERVRALYVLARDERAAS